MFQKPRTSDSFSVTPQKPQKHVLHEKYWFRKSLHFRGKSWHISALSKEALCQIQRVENYAKVKCRKITHGYCTLKIEPGLHFKFKLQLHGTMQWEQCITQQHWPFQLVYMSALFITARWKEIYRHCCIKFESTATGYKYIDFHTKPLFGT